MSAEDSSVPAAVARASAAIAAAIDAIAGRLGAGGRLIYVGAGTSGRLAALDAAECESTFSTAPGQVVALLAGGLLSSPTEQEAAEDDADGGRARGAGARRRARSTPSSASAPAAARRTWSVALDAAREVGALTVAVVSADGSRLGSLAEHEIAVVVGPEILAGSTRLKAGTAQKLVLNMLSTIAMIRLGKTFGNLMVDVYATNEKLHARVRRVVRQATGADPQQVEETLAAAGGDAKVAIVSLLARRRRRDGASAAGSGGRRHTRRARSVRLGVEAALVGGRLVPGDLEIVGGCVGRRRSPRRRRPRHRRTRLRRPAGERVRGGRLSRRRHATATRWRATRCSRPASPRTCRRSSRLPRAISSTRCAACRPRSAARASSARISKARSSRRVAWGRIRRPPAAIPIRGCSPACSRPARSASSRWRRSCPARSSSSTSSSPRGITVSCGHSDATAAEASVAFDRGASTVTHLFNAMRPFSHRDPGIVGAALIRTDVIVQLIVDGVHLAPEAVLLAWAAAPNRVALVTDAIAGAGLGDGSYALGTMTVEVRDGVVRREDGVLAGSALTMAGRGAKRARASECLSTQRCARRARSRRASLRDPQRGQARDRPAGRHRRARRRPRGRARPRRRRDPCRLLRRPPRCPRRARSSSRRSASSPPRCDGSSSRRPRSRRRPTRYASAAAGSCASSGTARPTTPPRTASTPSACCRG